MRKPFIAAAGAVAVVGSTLAALPASAAVSDVPADCAAYTTAYRSDGQRLAYGYNARKAGITAYPGDKLAWVPSAWQQWGAAGDTDVFISSELATHPSDGYIYDLERRGERTNGVWKMTKNTASRIASGFAGTRILANGSTYLYRVAGTSLYRYKVTYTSTKPTLSAPVTLRTTGWNAVKTLTFERTEGTGSAKVDVLIGTKTSGELVEWRVNVAKPSTISSTVLKSTGWAGFSSLTSGYCGSHQNGRSLLGITTAGAASIYFDANRTDRIGTDIKGGSLGSLGWTAKSYGQ